jgi:ribosomal protein RSM22 (predicted rRNA methylase)
MLRARVLCTSAAGAPWAGVSAVGTKGFTKRPRRLAASPTLPLEAVAIEAGVQRAIERILATSRLSSRDVRKASRLLDVLRSPDSLPSRKRPKPKRGQPVVPAPADFSSESVAVASAVTGSPISMAANVYVMSEVRRCLPNLVPKTMLDFGAGVAPSVSAVARVFRRRNDPPRNSEALDTGADGGSHSRNAQVVNDRMLESDIDLDIVKQDQSENANSGARQGERKGRAQLDWLASGGQATLDSVVLVDHAENMRRIGTDLLRCDEFLGLGSTALSFSRSSTSTATASCLNDVRNLHGGQSEFDIVSASFSLSEVVRTAMAMTNSTAVENDSNLATRGGREKLAERRLRATVRALWRYVKPGGVLVIVEDGTVGGFETVLFARQALLALNSDETVPAVANELHNGEVQADERLLAENVADLKAEARVVAPCLHSKSCPLEGTIDRHRVCRFVQRLNRPLFLRTAKPMSTGYEDMYFSYIVMQKMTANLHADATSDDKEVCTGEKSDSPWGRLIRAPLRKGKHVVVDGCTHAGVLERRVVSKKNAADGVYSLARKARWGDVWPMPVPGGSAQSVNF